MTEEIIIDGVNVAGCDGLNKILLPLKQCNLLQFKTRDGGVAGRWCTDHSNCYYKQLKRLEQENKKLKKDVQLFKCLDTFGENECHCAYRCLGNEFCEDADKKINKYRSALEDIKHILEIHKDELEECLHNDIDGMIQSKINEVLK